MLWLLTFGFSQTFKVSPNKVETKKEPEDTVGNWTCVYFTYDFTYREI